MAEHDLEKEIPVVWVDLDEQPVLFCNRLLIQHYADSFILSLGHMAPPVLIGTEEDQRDQFAKLELVPIRPIVRVSLSPLRIRELIEILQKNLATFEGKKADES